MGSGVFVASGVLVGFGDPVGDADDVAGEFPEAVFDDRIIDALVHRADADRAGRVGRGLRRAVGIGPARAAAQV